MAKKRRMIWVEDETWEAAKICAIKQHITVSKYVESCIKDNLQFNAIPIKSKKAGSDGPDKTP